MSGDLLLPAEEDDDHTYCVIEQEKSGIYTQWLCVIDRKNDDDEAIQSQMDEKYSTSGLSETDNGINKSENGEDVLQNRQESDKECETECENMYDGSSAISCTIEHKFGDSGDTDFSSKGDLACENDSGFGLESDTGLVSEGETESDPDLSEFPESHVHNWEHDVKDTVREDEVVKDTNRDGEVKDTLREDEVKDTMTNPTELGKRDQVPCIHDAHVKEKNTKLASRSRVSSNNPDSANHDDLSHGTSRNSLLAADLYDRNGTNSSSPLCLRHIECQDSPNPDGIGELRSDLRDFPISVDASSEEYTKMINVTKTLTQWNRQISASDFQEQNLKAFTSIYDILSGEMMSFYKPARVSYCHGQIEYNVPWEMRYKKRKRKRLWLWLKGLVNRG